MTTLMLGRTPAECAEITTEALSEALAGPGRKEQSPPRAVEALRSLLREPLAPRPRDDDHAREWGHPLARLTALRDLVSRLPRQMVKLLVFTHDIGRSYKCMTAPKHLWRIPLTPQQERA